MVLYLQSLIEDIKVNQRLGFLQGHNVQTVQPGKIGTIAQSDMFGGPSEDATDSNSPDIGGNGSNSHGTREGITDVQMHTLVTLKERDKKIDKEIEGIGQGVDTLNRLARTLNEEATSQGKTLDRIQDKVEFVHDRTANINERMKETLARARQSDKICVVRLIMK